MELNEAMDSIQSKLTETGSRMTEDEESVLKANPDDPNAVCFYAMGLLMNSSVRYKKLFFRGYDEMQNEAFALLGKETEKGNALAIYLMAQVKCGMFGKFPRYPDEGRALFEKYYALTGDSGVKEDVLDRWDEFDGEMREHFNDMKIYEVMTDMRNQGFTEFSSHDEAYYEERSKQEDKK